MATLGSSGVSTDDNVTGGSGAWVVRFDFTDGTKRWVAWSPNSQSYNLTGLTNVATVVRKCDVDLAVVLKAHAITLDGMEAASHEMEARHRADAELRLFKYFRMMQTRGDERRVP